MRYVNVACIVLLVAVPAYAAGINPCAMKDWSIVVSGKASPSEHYAAEEFQRLFRQLTGIDLPVAAQAKGKARQVRIGADAVAEAGINLPPDTGEESLSIRIEKKRILIAGGRTRGTLYGVYEFFERYCGVRFLTAEQTYFPPKETLAPLSEAEYSYTPPFSFRWSYYKENSDRPDFAARMRVNTVVKDEKMGGSTRQTLIGHSYCRWITTEKYGKTHPEYFALIDGERRCTVQTPASEPCVTNPEVIDIITQGVLDDLAANPDLENVAVSQNDNDAYCRCPQCEAINQREGTPMGANLALVNAVAERVEQKYPKVKIGTLAYWYTRKAPKTIVPRKNVQIQLCSIECCELHPIDDPNCPKNREFCEDMRAWKNICSNVWVWNYNTNFSYYDLPYPNLYVIGPNLRFFQANNARGVFMQANGNGNSGEFCDLRNYVLSRTLWNPTLDSAALVEEFCRLHYEEAAPVILDYIRLMRDNAEAKHCHPNCGAFPNELGLTPEVAQQAVDLFAKAKLLVKSDLVRDRIDKASIPAFRALILVNGCPWKIENGICRRDFPEKYKDLVPTYIALCKKFNMSMVSEQLPSADYFDRLQKMEAMPVARIENAVWRLTVLPEQNGKLIELFHKPSGHYMLPALTRENILQGAMDEVGQLGFLCHAFSAFQCKVEGSTIRLTRTLEDGAAIERTLSLDPKHPEVIACTSRLTNRGTAAKTYQFRVRPEFDGFTDKMTPDTLRVYIKDQPWTDISAGWDQRKGPDKARMLAAKGGGLAYFSPLQKAGMIIEYDPKQVKYPSAIWRPQYQQLNLEVFAQERELKPGESLELSYQLRFLDKAL